MREMIGLQATHLQFPTCAFKHFSYYIDTYANLIKYFSQYFNDFLKLWSSFNRNVFFLTLLISTAKKSEMGHTVMCVCTVYFTAIVGCAFSSPRLTAGENQQNDSKTVHETRLEVEIKETISSTKKVNSPVDETNVETFNETNLDDSGGGSKIKNFTENAENISPDTESTLNISSETDSINGMEQSLVKHLNKTQIKEIIRNRHTEGFKQQILSKLRMTYPPMLQHGKMPSLPMDELVKVYFELSNDERYRRHSHYYAKTVRKFIVGQDGE